MIKGLGVDIIEISRIERAYQKYGKAFLKKVFTKDEQDYCLKKTSPAASLAARFCAKEAAAKAFGLGFGEEIAFQDIEVTHDSCGKPEIVLSERLQKKFHKPRLLVSLSHSKAHATATVIWIENDETKT